MVICLEKAREVDKAVKDYFDDFPHLTSNDLLKDFCIISDQEHGWEKVHSGKYSALNNLKPMQLASFLLANYGARV